MKFKGALYRRIELFSVQNVSISRELRWIKDIIIYAGFRPQRWFSFGSLLLFTVALRKLFLSVWFYKVKNRDLGT